MHSFNIAFWNVEKLLKSASKSNFYSREYCFYEMQYLRLSCSRLKNGPLSMIESYFNQSFA